MPNASICRHLRRVLVVATLLLVHASSVVCAQTLSRVSLDSVGAIDLFGGQGTTGNPDASVDISSVIRFRNGWSAHLRPWFFKSSSEGSTWSRELYQAAVRYERPGATSVRLDAGFIALPIGLGMLDMRADTNPLVQPHLSYYMPLMTFDRGAPAVGPIAASYPLGSNVTVSTSRWDVRTAVVAAAPTRRYAVNSAKPNPAATPVVIAGGGVTPIAGLRIGGSLAAGRYATRDEFADPAGPARRLAMWTAEGEYAFAYTKLSAEFTRERFDHGASRDNSSTWYLQGVQTLTTRWFAAARHEAISAPPFPVLGPDRLSFRTTEAAIGYRLTPELTLRGSFVSMRWYTAKEFDHRAGAQVVWSRRWW